MTLDPKKLKSATGKARGVRFGGFVLCKVADSRDYVIAGSNRPFSNGGAAMKALLRATGAEDDDLDDSRFAVGTFQKTSRGLIATLDKGESSGSWNKNTLEKHIESAFDLAGVSAPSITTVVGDKSVRGVNKLDYDDIRYKKRVAGAKGMRILTPKERTEFDARVGGGKILASAVQNGWNLFVIGNDNRFYAAPFKRGGAGTGTFDHRSFFGGKQVRSAGMIRVRGSRIISVSDASNFYNVSSDMLALAVSKIAAGQQKALENMEVVVRKKRFPAAQWLASYAGKASEEAPEGPGIEITTKASFGPIEIALAELILHGAGSGSWLLRFNGAAGVYAFSSNNGGRIIHKNTATKRGSDVVLIERAKRGLILPGRGPLPLHKTIDDGDAERRIAASGQWLLRTDDEGKRVISLNNGNGIRHAKIGKIGAVKLITSLKLDPGKVVMP